ncbi:MAG: 5'-3' exonuclease, partial [Kineosporiaceae bacterium]
MAYRAFFALPVENFSTSTGQVTNAVYGFTSMLINVLRDEQPTHVAVAFDVSRATFRSEAYADYKANRTSSPQEFSGQVALIKEVLAALRIPVLEKEGYEADDVIATLTRQATGAGFEVAVSSGDRDALQLVTDDVTLLYPLRGVSELIRMTPPVVQERYGVPPELYPEVAALVGESSDNLPGVPGVGNKTAAKWLTLYGGLDGVIANAGAIGGKAGQSLRDHLAGVIRNRQLNRLVDDLELPVSLDDLQLRSWDREQVHQVFDGLEFRVLRDRLFSTLASPEPEAEGGFDLAVEHLDGAAVGEWLATHATSTTGLHVVGSWRAGRGDAEGLAL